MKIEPSRIRINGTRVTQTLDDCAKVEAIRQIKVRGQYAKINGVMVDLFSASAIIAVYDALSEANQVKYRAMPIHKMASVAFKLIK